MSDKKFTYHLPKEDTPRETTVNSVIIVGANGSGKTRLAAWMEQEDEKKEHKNVHRIPGQRSLNFSDHIQQRSDSEATALMTYGTTDHRFQRNKEHRWMGTSHDKTKNYVTKLIDDFEFSLAAIIAQTYNQEHIFTQEYKKVVNRGGECPPPPNTAIDNLIKIWKSVFPQRQLEFDDGTFFASLPDNDDPNKHYNANRMSDGERAVLYLASQVLALPPGKTIIIDEPELHLHRSIMYPLWAALEAYRPDLLFIYITHDTQFAASHRSSDKFWIKGFDGQNWDIQPIDDHDLPEDLLLEILGSRKPALFVEGNLDTQLYTALFPDYYVIPCGSCSQVINLTKAFRSRKDLHEYEVYGLIDRDYRTDREIEKYKKDNIYTLEVAEVENLFIVEELVRLMAQHMGKKDKEVEEVFNKVKNYVIQDRFKNQLDSQIAKSMSADLKYRMETIDLSGKNTDKTDKKANKIDKIRDKYDRVVQDIRDSFDKITKEHDDKFRNALSQGNYSEVLRLFNEKGLANSVGKYVGIANDEYCNTVLRLLNGEKRDEILDAIRPYVPIPQQGGQSHGDAPLPEGDH